MGATALVEYVTNRMKDSNVGKLVAAEADEYLMALV
jgi:hypothetical protein